MTTDEWAGLLGMYVEGTLGHKVVKFIESDRVSTRDKPPMRLSKEGVDFQLTTFGAVCKPVEKPTQKSLVKQKSYK